MNFFLLIFVVIAERWNVYTGVPINTPETCYSQWAYDTYRCTITAPDSTSIERHVCEVIANGRYEACMGL